MSSRKRKTKQPSRSSVPSTSNGTPTVTPAEKIIVKTEPLDTVEVKVEPHDDGFEEQGNMSLDVLAQVASDRLQNKTERQTAPKKARLTKRGAQSMSLLTLDQINSLSDKSLINLFAELDSNELTRNFTYSCRLMPETCSECFSSFGNENKAKSRLKDHLLTHLNQLRRDDPTFKAEPIHARKKRISAELGLIRHRRGHRSENVSRLPGGKSPGVKSPGAKSPGAKSPGAKSPGRSRADSAYTSIKPPSSSAVVEQHPTLATSLHFASPHRSINKRMANQSKLAARKLLRQSVKRKAIVDMTKDISADGDVAEDEEEKAEDDDVEDTTEATDTMGSNTEKERFINQLLSRIQPYQDHSYTSVFGKQWRNEPPKADEEMNHQGETSARTSAVKYNACDLEYRETKLISAATKAVVLKVNATDVACASSIHVPIIRLAKSSVPDGNSLPVQPPDSSTHGVSYEEVIVEGPGGTETLQGSYMKRRKRVLDMELYDNDPEEDFNELADIDEELDAQEEEHGEQLSISLTSTNRNVICNLPKDLERKLALKYIRELRCKRKEVPSLVCKICKTKSFTATATLMYHYRSHAGIKPFVCLICTETFTRQHSLNYHMLIHNNQSRFTCKDCGRKFRHPSHFKEHLRRHTGETPFSCTDCPLRFKTRNTYKRHLKTRHGKLLTANGIKLLPYDEFIKIRTKPSLFLNEDDHRISDYDDDEEGDDDEEDDANSVDTQDGDLETEPRAKGSVGTEPVAGTSLEARIDTPASNKLLQFCSQVVSQVS